MMVAQSIKNLPAVQETWIGSLGREDSLEKEMATHSSILAWKIPWTEEPGGLQSMGSQESNMIQQLNHTPSMNMDYLFIQFFLISIIRVAHQASLSITNYWSLLKLMSIESVMPSNHLILCRPLLLHSIFPSIRVFSNESALRIRWPKCWSFSFNINRSNEHLGLISFRMDWSDLLAVQGTLQSLLQHHSSKASNLCSTFFLVHLSHPYLTTGKTIALTRWTFVDKVMSLLFIYLFFVSAF